MPTTDQRGALGTLTKAELIEAVAAATNVFKQDAEQIVTAVLEPPQSRSASGTADPGRARYSRAARTRSSVDFKNAAISQFVADVGSEIV